MWSDINLRSFMAVTAHWLTRSGGSLEWKSALIAFRQVDGEHTGSHLAKIFFQILKERDIIHKVYCFYWY
jgi:hypothetical protein